MCVRVVHMCAVSCAAQINWLNVLLKTEIKVFPLGWAWEECGELLDGIGANAGGTKQDVAAALNGTTQRMPFKS